MHQWNAGSRMLAAVAASQCQGVKQAAKTTVLLSLVLLLSSMAITSGASVWSPSLRFHYFDRHNFTTAIAVLAATVASRSPCGTATPYAA